MKTACQIIVKGRVQGVGFRYFTQQAARYLGLTGFVKNLYNGDVEVFIEGEENQVKIFQEKLKEGPHYGHVTELNVSQEPFQNRYNRFEVEYE